LKIAVSTAVAAIQTGLPAVATTTLSFGISQTAKSNAIQTVLKTVENEDSIFVTCSNKTRTATTNRMIAQAFQLFKIVK
jgi:Ca2+-transporting ATPase